MHGLEKLTKKLRQQFEEHTGKSFECGITIEEIPNAEIYFHVAINILKLNEDGSADIIYLSKLKDST